MSNRQPIPESPDGNAMHGLVHAVIAYFVLIAFGAFLGATAWLLDWSLTPWSTW
ncbi:hypothetical protein [Nocardia sp. NPDC059239]|uniref:hypothetical protein n=1 Tax=unclassified Nocardia TaxID=2637762 RepID=UPI0036B844C3